MRASRGYQGVECYEGLPGSGKTYSMVARGVQRLREGRRVFTNAGFEIHDVHGCGKRSELLFSLEEVLTVPSGAVVLLDELPVFVNSRKSAEFPRGLLYRLTQVRKDGLELYYSAIDEMMVDVNVRRVTFWTWRCRRLSRMLPLFSRTLWPPVDRRRAEDGHFGREWFRIRKQVMEAYDTLSKVWIPPEVVESLLADVVKPWVPLSDELVDLLWAGGRDPEKARALLREYQERARLGVRGAQAEVSEGGAPGGPAGPVGGLSVNGWATDSIGNGLEAFSNASGLTRPPAAIAAEDSTTSSS